MRRFKVKVNSKEYIVEVEELKEIEGIGAKKSTQEQDSPMETKSIKSKDSSEPIINTWANNSVKAPMAGNIIKIDCIVGDQVNKGQVLIVLEAMKMENEIVAPRDGKIKNILVRQGSAVKNKQPLVELEG